MNAYITKTGSFLPGRKIENDGIPAIMGELEGEEEVRKKILRMNGIKSRHYALDHDQHPTHDVYELAALAAANCLGAGSHEIGHLSAGSTNTPMIGPGVSSILHDRLASKGIVDASLEINSNSGICSASAQALVNSSRAIRSGDHSASLCIGVEQPSAILKSSFIKPPDDRHLFDEKTITGSKWFMSVFLRSMLSDGAGAFLLENKPAESGVSYRINWTHSRSFAHQAPLCMNLESGSLLLSQNIAILAEHLGPCVHDVVGGAMAANNDKLKGYSTILPHLSSFYFKKHLTGVFDEMCDGETVAHWTNLETSGNTGAASIFIMLDEFTRINPPAHGDRILLFVPESGQFNFVLVSLTAIVDGGSV
jgi:3-oxoacyl-[acyl-carrier-protein] synthase-3